MSEKEKVTSFFSMKNMICHPTFKNSDSFSILTDIFRFHRQMVYEWFENF